MRRERTSRARYHGPSLLGLAAPLVVVGLWALLTETGLVRHRALAGPFETLRALFDALVGGTLAADLGATALRALVGVALGALFGVPLGVATGTSRHLSRALGPGLDFLRAVPPLLTFPLFLMAFGYGEQARIGVVAAAAALVTSLYVDAGARRGHPERLRALRAMGASRWQTIRWLHLYEIVPAFVTALRHAVSTGIIVAVVTEMIVGAERGLGSRAVDAQVVYDAPGLYAVIVLAGVFGLLASQLLLLLERRFVRWR